MVVINNRHVAMADDLWRTDRYFHHTRYIYIHFCRKWRSAVVEPLTPGREVGGSKPTSAVLCP